jgi:hypothetical protein
LSKDSWFKNMKMVRKIKYIPFFLLYFLLFASPASALSEGDCLNSLPLIVTGSVTDSNGIDPSSVMVTVDGTTPDEFYYDSVSGQWTATFFSIPDGPHTLTITATDGCGGGNTAIKMRGFSVETNPDLPTVTITEPSDGVTICPTVTITGTASDPTSEIVLILVNGQTAEGTTSWSITFTGQTGSPTYNAIAVDACGNSSPPDSVTVGVDTTPPTISVTSPTDGSTISTSTIIVKGTAIDDYDDSLEVTVFIYATSRGSGIFSASIKELPVDSDGSNDIELGDVDGDNDLDIIIGNFGQNRLYLNDGSGNFTDVTGSNLPVFENASNDIEFEDVDGDNDLDIFTANYMQQNQLYLNNGNGVFTVATSSNLPVDTDHSRDAEFGDVDGDNDLDIFIADRYNEQNRLYLNDGSGVFSDATSSNLPSDLDTSYGAMLGDVDGDNDLDIIIANYTEQNRLYLNDGNGIFTDATENNLPADTDDSFDDELGDFDGDGNLDTFIANVGEQNSIYLNDGSGNFIDVTAFVLPIDNNDSWDSKFGDVDGDNDLDIIVANLNGQNRLYLNDGSGVFTDITDSQLPLIGDDTADAKFGDVDGDGDLDLVYANRYEQNRLLINLNQFTKTVYADPVTGKFTATFLSMPEGEYNLVVTSADACGNSGSSDRVDFEVNFYGPVITNVSPTTGTYGDPVTITGSNFGSSQGSSTVTFDGVTAPVFLWSDTSIQVTVPSGVWVGKRIVQVTVNGRKSSGGLFDVYCVDFDPPTWNSTVGVQDVEVWGECDCPPPCPWPEAIAAIYWNAASDYCMPVKYNIYYNDGTNYYEKLGVECGANIGGYDCLGCITVYSGNTYWVMVRALDSSTPPNEDPNTVEISFPVP